MKVRIITTSIQSTIVVENTTHPEGSLKKVYNFLMTSSSIQALKIHLVSNGKGKYSSKRFVLSKEGIILDIISSRTSYARKILAPKRL